jgi:S-adenosylmethionine:tRNA ribosyltransferase-isomerase
MTAGPPTTPPPGRQAGERPWFELPRDRLATQPPEARGLARDEVRLLVAGQGAVVHARFRELPRFLRPGDLVVVNTSATLAAAVDGRRADGEPVTVHFATPLADGEWVVELRSGDPGGGRVRDGTPGETVELPDGVRLTLVAPYRRPRHGSTRLWSSRPALEGGVEAYLSRRGRPVTYGHVTARWPLTSYQTVFAREPGSAEMPSAGRPFTPSLVTELVTGGVLVAPVLLHAGVSSLEAGEPPLPERFRVPAYTAELVTATRRRGGRVVAVGTTVVRALETVAAPDGAVRAGQGRTELLLGPDRPARAVQGLVTGFHEPDASHLLLLRSVVGDDLVRATYRAALGQGYLWHEFGDSCLLMAGPPG